MGRSSGRRGGEALERGELIRSASQFREVFKKGRILRGKYLTLFYRKGRERKIGFVLKRDLKGAVKRNKVKRRLREIYRKEKRRIDPRVEIIVLTDKRTEKVDYHQVKEDLLRLLHRAGILRNG